MTVLLVAVTSAAWGQSVIMRSLPLRLTVPVGVEYTNSTTLTINASGLVDEVDTINLTTTGTLPPGAAATLSIASINTNGEIIATLFWTNPPLASAGDYDLAVEATGAASYRLPIPVHVAYFWGGTEFTNSANPNWSAAGNWQGGAIPAATDAAVFGDAGGQANAPGPTNVVVSANTEVASLRFTATASATRAHNIEINNDATLRVSGPGLAFSLLRDSKNIGNPLLATFSGNGSLVVSNPAASIGVLIDNAQTTTWDMRNLNRFEADVVRIGLGDFRVYPNYETNGYVSTSSAVTGRPSRFFPNVWLAKTNIIKCSWVDPYDYNDGGTRNYALSIANSEASVGSNIRYSLGLYNEFYLDSILWVGARYGSQSMNLNFNSPNSYALFRGIGGGRMSVWAQADTSGPNVSGSNTRSRDVNFSNGRVDALIDRLYLTRTSTNSAGHTLQATLIIGGNSPGSIFDVNTAYIGNQDVTNINPGTIEARSFGNTFGNLVVNSNAVFKVNDNLYLAYTIANAPGLPDQPETVRGLLNINNSGVVMANNITASQFSSSEIVMAGGGNLIVTNRIGTTELPLTILNMNNSILTVTTDAGTNAPSVFVKSLVTGGTGNTLRVASLTGVTSFPVTIPIISYVDPAAPNFNLEVPPGLYGYVVNNVANNTVDAVISDVPPKNVVWNGTPGNIWNTSAANWQGAQVFVDGDSATFDDSASGSTTVDISGTVFPGSGGVLISNETKAYTFTGGAISGTSLMTKEGAASLAMNASSQIALSLNQGAVTGSGTLGVVTALAGTSVNFSGDMTRLNTAGTAASSGNILLGLTVSGGTFANSGTVSGPVSMTGGAITNNGTISTTGISTLSSGALLVHNGQYNAGTANVNSRLSVGGTVIGTGVFSDLTGDANGNNGRFSLDSGGVLSPGNNGIGTFTIEARFDLNPNARLLIEVDLNNPQPHDIVAVDKWSNTRGIIQMTNIGTIPFAVGQSFMIISNNFGIPNTPEAASDFSIDPKSPGVGLQWDVSNLKTNGILAIVAAPTIPPTMTNVFTATNLTLSWPANYLGWQLQVQTNDLNTGITDTWYSVPGSESTSQQVWPIDPANPTVFFRLYSIAP